MVEYVPFGNQIAGGYSRWVNLRTCPAARMARNRAHRIAINLAHLPKRGKCKECMVSIDVIENKDG
jgi:hypothetical protein